MLESKSNEKESVQREIPRRALLFLSFKLVRKMTLQIKKIAQLLIRKLDNGGGGVDIL